MIDTQAPTLTQFKNILVREETLLELTFESDDNGRTDSEISFVLRNQPEGVSLNTDASKIYWTPTEEQGPGKYSFELVANDGTQESTSIINVTVEEVNIWPVAKTPWGTPPPIPRVHTRIFRASLRYADAYPAARGSRI